MENLIEGRMIHIRTADDAKCQPAIVVLVWSPTVVNAVVFRDGSNDTRHDDKIGSDLTRWATSVEEGAGPHKFHDVRDCRGAA